MNTFLSIAWRNIWRNKRRSALTISMIAFGLFLSIFYEAVYYGTSELMFKEAIDMHIGSLQIHKKGYQENKTLSYIFAPAEKLTDILKHEKNTEKWS